MYGAVQRKVCYTNTVVVSKSNLRMRQYIYLNSKNNMEYLILINTADI